MFDTCLTTSVKHIHYANKCSIWSNKHLSGLDMMNKKEKVEEVTTEMKWLVRLFIEITCEISHRLERRSTSEDVGPRMGWIVRSHIDWREERNILYKDVETSP